MLGLKFTGDKVGENQNDKKHGTYYFDNYHSDTENGNQEVGNNKENLEAIKMANFSVTEHYSILVKNYSSKSKKIYYMVGNESGMYFKYSVKGKDAQNNVVNISNHGIRCVLPWGKEKTCVFYEMFHFEIGPNEERELDFEITLPNVGVMGVYNILYSE